CSAVDRVHAVGVHVVGKPGRAPDAGDEDDVVPRNAELGHESLDRGQDRVVAAPRAPTYFLVGLEVLGLEVKPGAPWDNRVTHESALLAAFRRGRPRGTACHGPV